MRDLERLLPKSKGITTQTVKEVVQSLVDDKMVCAEKIGTSNYFWAFPSTATVRRQIKLEQAEADLMKIQTRTKKLKEDIELHKQGREEGEERSELQEKYVELKKKLEMVRAELSEYKENDPAVFKQKMEQVGKLKMSINRWTDNLFILEDWCVKNIGVERAAFKEMFSLSDQIDYIS